MMRGDAQQLEMLSAAADPLSVELQEEHARRCKSRQDAIRKCFEVSGLTPKQVYDPLKIQQATFTKIIAGQAFLNPDLLPRFMEMCGNIIPVRYDALITNHALVPLKTDLEAEVDRLAAENAELKRAMRLFGEVMRGNG